jgi:hypothetical protein
MAFLRNLVARTEFARADQDTLAYFHALQAERARLHARQATAPEPTPPGPAAAPEPRVEHEPEPSQSEPQHRAEGAPS